MFAARAGQQCTLALRPLAMYKDEQIIEKIALEKTEAVIMMTRQLLKLKDN